MRLTEKDCLLVTDIQNDFCAGGALAVPDAEQILPLINHLMSLFSHTVATQDWHPPAHLSFASSHPGKRPFLDTVMLGSIEQQLWPDHCVQGSEGAAFHRLLNPEPIAMIIRKGMRKSVDSYSSFRDNDRTFVTGLSGFLKERGITRVFLSGLATDFCVLYSALDAIAEGFETMIIAEACRGVDVPNGSVASALEKMQRMGAQIVTVAELFV